jgi:hypothetical protein
VGGHESGVVLEAVDFATGIFALRVATSIALRRLRPSSSPAALRDEAVAWFDAVLYGIHASTDGSCNGLATRFTIAGCCVFTRRGCGT